MASAARSSTFPDEGGFVHFKEGGPETWSSLAHITELLSSRTGTESTLLQPLHRPQSFHYERVWCFRRRPSRRFKQPAFEVVLRGQGCQRPGKARWPVLPFLSSPLRPVPSAHLTSSFFRNHHQPTAIACQAFHMCQACSVQTECSLCDNSVMQLSTLLRCFPLTTVLQNGPSVLHLLPHFSPQTSEGGAGVLRVWR